MKQELTLELWQEPVLFTGCVKHGEIRAFMIQAAQSRAIHSSAIEELAEKLPGAFLSDYYHTIESLTCIMHGRHEEVEFEDRRYNLMVDLQVAVIKLCKDYLARKTITG